MYSQLDFLVKIYPWQDHKRELEKVQEVGCSMKSSALLGKFNLSSSCLRMLEIYCLTKTGRRSKKSSFKLPKQGTMQNGALYQQQIWEPVTSANGSGSLPTPTNQRAGKGEFLKTLVTKEGEPAKIGERAYNPKTGKHVQITLDRAVELLPTPTTMDHLPQRGYDSMVKQTQVHRKGRTKLANLREAVNPEAVKLFNKLQKLPTPMARDWKGRSGQGFQDRSGGRPGQLPDALTQAGQSMHLNPSFVEEMMGYPIGYLV